VVAITFDHVDIIGLFSSNKNGNKIHGVNCRNFTLKVNFQIALKVTEVI